MKSRCGGGIAVCLLVSAVSLVAQTPTISFGTQSLQSDGTVVVPVQLASAGFQVAAVQFDITFDSSVMSFAASAGSSASSASKTVNNADVTPAILRIVLSGLTQDSIPDGPLVSLFITPVSSGFSGTLNLSNVSASDPSGTGVTVSPPGGSPPIMTFSIVNGASERGGAIAPGEIISLYQTGILPATAAMSDVTMTFNGTRAPILYAGPDQINAVTPFGLAGQSSATVVVTYQGTGVGQGTDPVAPTAPGIFTAGGSAVVVNQDGTINSPSSPAAVLSTVSLYATGAGIFQNPILADGQIIPTGTTPTSTPVAPLGMGVGNGNDVKIIYKGPVPGFISGLMQINFVIPRSTAPGSAVPLTVTIGGVQSPPVTIAVH